MAYAIDVIRFNLIFNFFLFFILIILFFVAYKTENDHNSILYSRNPENLWCYPDVHCQNLLGDTANFFLAFNFNNKFNEINSDQNITFQSYDSAGGTSTQVFNIYWDEDLPGGATQLGGVCAGYLNYSDDGTSVYLKYYNNSTSWLSGIDNGAVANIFSQAYSGTSANILDQASLTKKANTMIYQLVIPGAGSLSVTATKLDDTALNEDINSIIGLKSAFVNTPAQISDNPNTAQTNAVMESFINAIKSDTKSRATSGASILRCIDPSFVTDVPCEDVTYIPDVGGYCLNTKRKALATKAPSKCETFCTGDMIGTTGALNAMVNNNCIVPFCTNSGATFSSDNKYKVNNFKLKNSVKDGDDELNQYSLNNKPLTDVTTTYGTANADTFNSAVQAQHLLFCGGTSTTNNNFSDTDLSTDEGKFPSAALSSVGETPYMATQPNAKKSNGKVILGFK